MKTRKERIIEFIKYHNGDDGECNGIVLKRWADNHNLTEGERLDLCYMFALCYCVESSIYLFNNINIIKSNPNKIEKQNIIFQSDRKYIRMKDNFQKSLDFFVNQHTEIESVFKAINRKNLDLNIAIPLCEEWYMYGRFTAFLFLETLAQLLELDVINTTIDWKNGNTATSGLLNVYGYDKSADEFDKTGRLNPNIEPKMDKMLKALQGYITESGGNANTTMVETSLCAYRKFYKGSRYNGYYLDRMLEEINTLQTFTPELSAELIEIRKSAFDKQLLGELNGWNGIRKQRKKHYLRTGEV